MFGIGKTKGKAEYEKIGRDIAEHVLGYTRIYCDRVVYIRASQLLRQLSERLDDFPSDPNDDVINKEKAVLLQSFLIHLMDELRPLQDQLTAQLTEQYGELFKSDGETWAYILQYAQERFDEQYDRISDAGRYVSGLAESYISKLLDEPETPSA